MSASPEKKNNCLIETRIISTHNIPLFWHKRNTRLSWNLAVISFLVWVFGCASSSSPYPDELEDNESSTSVFLDEDDASSSLNDTGQEGTDTDECPEDDVKLSPGLCGCGVPDADGDGDGTPDCRDECPNDSNKTEPGSCGCGVEEICGEWTWIYEAEDRTSEHDASFSAGNPGYFGTGYMDYGGGGSFVEWNSVTLPAAGRYTLDFRYASSHYGRPAKLFVGGEEKSVIPFSAGHSSWSDWRVNTVTATLPAGTVAIRVVAIDTGPNLDRMTITWAGS